MAGKKLLLGLDIGTSGAKVCLLKESRGRYEVQTIGSANFQSDSIVDGSILNRDDVSNVIRDLVSTLKIRQKQCAIAISGYSVIVKRVRMPDMTDEELRNNLRFEVEQHIPFDYDDVIVDTVVLERNETQKKMEILLVASKKEVVNEYISVARDAGLDVVVVDTVSFALQNMAETVYQIDMQNSTVAIVNIGASMTSLTMVVDGMPAFTRDITIGGNQISEEIQKKFSITREEADAFKIGRSGDVDAVVPRDVEDVTRVVSENIANEIRRSITFFYETSNSDHIDKVLLCGGAIKNKTTLEVLKKSLDAPVIIVNPFESLTFNSNLYSQADLEDKGPELAVAFGLALRAADE